MSAGSVSWYGKSLLNNAVLHWKDAFRVNKNVVPCYKDGTLIMSNKVQSQVIDKIDLILNQVFSERGATIMDFLDNSIPSISDYPDFYVAEGDKKGLPKINFVNEVLAKESGMNGAINENELHIFWNLHIHSKQQPINTYTVAGLKRLIFNDMDEGGNLPVLQDVDVMIKDKPAKSPKRKGE